VIEYRRIQREDKEIARVTCNKCGRSWGYNDQDRPQFTTINHTYGYGSPKDGDKYVSHVCEPCMDEIYASFAKPPQVVGMIVWGEDPGDPVVYLDDDPSTAAPVAPAVEDHASQEEAP
jgi:hypothetical protein